ncbi:MAG: CDGSH iron-sulfur domain-containing protein [Sulfurospirillaceae bacterium]|nr:CDGSH iron-sulfur domain-containing protein [Sulfurospirillaceae bacterium]
MAQPVKVSLEAGKNYYFCTCGKSTDGVLCSGAHKGSEFTPTIFSVEESKDYHLCACKKSANVPFCDGSHKS